MPTTPPSGIPSETSSSCTIIGRRSRRGDRTLRAGFFRIQDALNLRVHRKDLPLLRAALAIEPGLRLLDIGGGTGVFTAAFAAGCEEIVVLEPDARKVAYGERRRPALRFVPGKAEEIPFPDAHFDRVVAIASFHHVEDPDRGLQEVRRVLRPSGRFVLEEFDPRQGRGRRVHILESTFGSGRLNFYTPAELETELEAHGFGLLSVETAGPGYLATAQPSGP